MDAENASKEHGQMLTTEDMPVEKKETLLQDSQRRKILKTTFILATYFILGIVRGQEGVAFLDLLLTTNSDIERGSMLHTIGALGYLVGCLLCGFLYDKFNNDIIYLVSSLITGLLTIAIPWCSYLPLMVIIFGLRSFFAGAIESGSSIICSRIWLAKAGPVLQTLQFVFSLGGIVSTLVTDPFLLPKKTSWANDSLQANWTSSITHGNSKFYISSNYSHQEVKNASYTDLFDFDNNPDLKLATKTTQVYVAFIISGCLLMAAAIVLTFNVAHNLLRGKTSTSYIKVHRPDQERSYPNIAKYAGFALLGLHSFSYGCILRIWRAYLMTFLVELLGWTKTRGSVGNALFWGGITAGRFLCIFLIKVIKPGSLLICDYSGLIIAFVVLVFIFKLPEVLCWILLGTVGLFMASIFATNLFWIDRYLIPLSGKVIAYNYVCQFTGTITHMALLGYLFEEFTPMWFVYLSLLHASLGLLSFVALSVAACKIRQYRIRHQQEVMGESIHIQ